MTAGVECRHEYVRIFQRRLKGLDRRLVATKAYLPVGFKIGDFSHLSEGSYCFCTKCRKRLFPKRSPQEKEQARQERLLAKRAGVTAGFAPSAYSDEDMEGLSIRTTDELDLDEFEEKSTEFDEAESENESKDDDGDEDKMRVDVEVDELEVESVDVEDIKAEGVKLATADDFEESCELDEDIES